MSHTTTRTVHPGTTLQQARRLETAAELAHRAAVALAEAGQEEWCHKAATEAREASDKLADLLETVPTAQETLRGEVATSAAEAWHHATRAEHQARAADDRAQDALYNPWG